MRGDCGRMAGRRHHYVGSDFGPAAVQLIIYGGTRQGVRGEAHEGACVWVRLQRVQRRSETTTRLRRNEQEQRRFSF